jgi:hypothetical protein
VGNLKAISDCFHSIALLAFGSALFLFGVFLLADEILKIYDTAQQHMTIFIALLVSLITTMIN